MCQLVSVGLSLVSTHASTMAVLLSVAPSGNETDPVFSVVSYHILTKFCASLSGPPGSVFQVEIVFGRREPLQSEGRALARARCRVALRVGCEVDGAAFVSAASAAPVFAFALAAMQKLPSVPSMPLLFIFFALGPGNSVEVLVVFHSVAGLIHGMFAYWIVSGLGYHDLDGAAFQLVLFFVTMFYGQSETPPVLYLSGEEERYAHTVGLTHTPASSPLWIRAMLLCLQHLFFLESRLMVLCRSFWMSGSLELIWLIPWRPLLMVLVPC